MCVWGREADLSTGAGLTDGRYGVCFADTDEIVQPVDQGHYDYGVPTPKVAAQQPLNTLNTINAVLMRKTALNKLSR